MSEHGADRLAKTVRTIHDPGDTAERQQGPVDREPASVYEIITRQMVEDMGRELRDVRRRIDTLLFLVVATIIGDIIVRLAGVGA